MAYTIPMRASQAVHGLRVTVDGYDLEIRRWDDWGVSDGFPRADGFADPFESRVCRALGKTHGREAIPILREAYKSGGVWVRDEVVCALGAIGDPRGMDIVIRALEDPDSYVRESAAHAAVDIDPVGAMPILVERLNDDAWSVRWAVCRALLRAARETDRYEIPVPAHVRQQVIDALTRRLASDTHTMVRLCACEALEAWRAEESVPTILDALHDDDEFVRLYAMFAMLNLQGTDALPYLQHLEHDPDAEVRETYAIAVSQLRGDAHG